MQKTTEVTTAQALGALRRELIEEGFAPEEALGVVMQYVRVDADTRGFGVKAKVTV